MGKPKYELGDIVKMKANKDTEFFITAIVEETCRAGTQVTYTGRVWTAGQMSNKIHVSEIELGEKRK